MLTYREITPEEYPMVPREVPGTELYTPENSKMIGGFNEHGEIVTTFTFFLCAHLEPMWIRKDYRHSATILRRMSETMKALLKKHDVQQVYTVVLNSTPVLHRFARWFGAKPVDGVLYTWKEQA